MNYIVHGHATFQTALQTVETRQTWFDTYGGGRYQLLVAEMQGSVVGYSSSSPYRTGPAFDTTVETSVYLHPHHTARGTGSALYTMLLERMRRQPVHLAVAGVALPNAASLALHRRMEFEEVGTFREYARKNGEWISSTWFQRRITGLAKA
ncbi:N-acetyltransferase family protein [Roseomonas sp. F4]